MINQIVKCSFYEESLLFEQYSLAEMTEVLKQERVMQECQNFNIVQRTCVTYVKVSNVDIYVQKKFYNWRSSLCYALWSQWCPSHSGSVGVVAKSFALKNSLHMSCLWLCI